jgi:hypothetical protein
MRQGLRPEISLTLSPGARSDSGSGSGSYANSATRRPRRDYFTDAWSRRKYHCGLNW